MAALKAAKARQAPERLALGHDGGAWAYVVSNEVGEPYSPAVPSRYWRDTVKAAIPVTLTPGNRTDLWSR